MTSLRNWLIAWVVTGVVAVSAGCSFDPAGTGDDSSGRSQGVRMSDAGPDGETPSERPPRSTAGNRGVIGRSGSSGGDDGSAGRTAEPVPAADATVAEPPIAPAADGGISAIPDAGRPGTNLDDAGDDTDAGADPEPPQAGTGGSGAAGASGAAAGAGGMIAMPVAGMPAAGAAAPPPVISDRDLLLSLLDLTITILQTNPNADGGALLTILASAVSPDPALLALVLSFVTAADSCTPQSQTCASACDLVRARCMECVANEACVTSLRATCGPGADQCR